MPYQRELTRDEPKPNPPSDPPPRIPNILRSSWFNTDNDRRFAEYWISVILIITFVACLYFSDSNAVIYLKKLPEPPDFYYYHDMFLNKTDINHPDNVYDVKIRVASQTFSAQMPIWIEWVNITQTHGESYNDTLSLIFPRAIYDTDKPPGAFERTPVVIHLSPSKAGFRDGSSSPGPAIRYSIQGCYNVVLAAPQPGLASRQLYENDCTELSIDGIDVRKSFELERENIKIQNLLIEQNNIVIKISAFAFTVGLAISMIAIIVNWRASKKRPT